ncbi:MAG: PAS domain-containing protein, partial [Deltaproteobacteria bacterium]|nr:PAS domain-containing protein [Deltaproteobacteria bacterium]
MSATPRSNLRLIDGIPAQQMLEGLANLHQSVVVTDTEGRVLWASRALERTLCGASRSVDFGADLSLDPDLGLHFDLHFDLAALCDRYLETQCEAVHTSRQRSSEPGVGRFPAPPRLSRQIAEILRHLEQRGSLCHYRIEASWLEARGTELEINAFRVDSRGPETERAGSPQIVPLNVIILRPAPKLEAGEVSAGDVNSFYKSVLDLLPEATLTIDQSGFISYVNARVVALLGTSRRELIDTPISLYLSSSAILPINASFDREFEPIERSAIELAPPGRPKLYVEVAIRKLNLPDGTTAGRIIQLRDTTSQLRVSERFKQKIASLESYVHTVSHDL